MYALYKKLKNDTIKYCHEGKYLSTFNALKMFLYEK